MNTMLPHLFWIDHSFARRKLIEIAFATASWAKIYTLPDGQDLQFRYLELKPMAVIMGQDILEKLNPEEQNFLVQHKVKIIQVIKSDETKSLKFSDQLIGEIAYSLNPMSLNDQLKKIILS